MLFQFPRKQQQTATHCSWVTGVGEVQGDIIRLSNGRPYTSGVDVTYALEEIKYTNYFFDFQDVAKLNMLINNF